MLRFGLPESHSCNVGKGGPPAPCYRWTNSSRGSFAFSCCPFRLDLDPSLTPGCVVAKTAPLPVLGTLAQPSLHRIAMNIAQLFHKLRVISNVEIVVPLLPEMLFPHSSQERA